MNHVCSCPSLLPCLLAKHWPTFLLQHPCLLFSDLLSLLCLNLPQSPMLFPFSVNHLKQFFFLCGFSQQLQDHNYCLASSSLLAPDYHFPIISHYIHRQTLLKAICSKSRTYSPPWKGHPGLYMTLLSINSRHILQCSDWEHRKLLDPSSP